MKRALALALLLSACGNSDPDTIVADHPVADRIFTGGTIHTGTGDVAAAVAVTAGRIVGVGDVAGWTDAQTDIVDLGGATLLPGFTDAHAHLVGIGLREMTLNLEGTGSIAELVAKVEAAAADLAPGEVLYGRGWIETGWPEGRFPTASDLDAVAPDNPVVLVRADGHALVANTAALIAAGITDDTPDVEGGRIDRDAQGRANGMVIDNSMAPLSELVGNPDAATLAQAYAQGLEVYAALGWTGVHSMSVPPENVAVLEGVLAEGGTPLRTYLALDGNALTDMSAFPMDVDGRDLVTTRGLKLYMDGALGSRGAALDRPYSDDPGNDGLLTLTKETGVSIFSDALREGVQLHTHAIGDRGNRLLLDWYAEALAAVPEEERAIADPRFRIEHAQIMHPDDIDRMVGLGIIPSMQPSHAIGDLYFAPDRLGQDRLDGAYAWRDIIDAGSVIAGGSDAPVERGDPRIEFYAAVARAGVDGFQNADWRPDQAVTREEALKMFTLWPAYASFREDELGTIEVGKLADFTVFADDIMTIPVADILETDVVMTVVGGEIVSP